MSEKTAQKPNEASAANQNPTNGWTSAWAEWKHRWRDPITLFTLLLVVVGAFQYFSLKDTDKTLRLQQRAWIAPHHLLIDGQFRAGEKLGYTLFYGNVGHEPATKIVINQDEKTFDVPATITSWDAVFEQAGIKKFDCGSSQPNANGFVVYPSTSPDRTFGVVTQSTIENESDVDSGRKILVIRGCIGYETLGTPHYSQWCFFWPAWPGQPPTVLGVKMCPGGTNAAN